MCCILIDMVGFCVRKQSEHLKVSFQAQTHSYLCHWGKGRLDPAFSNVRHSVWYSLRRNLKAFKP